MSAVVEAKNHNECESFTTVVKLSHYIREEELTKWFQRITWKQTERIIKRTSKFKGYLRYRNDFRPFDTEEYPFTTRSEDKIT